MKNRCDELRNLVAPPEVNRNHNPITWNIVESILKTALPKDYKEIVEYYGPGTFGEMITLLVPSYELEPFEILYHWKLFKDSEEQIKQFDPIRQAVYPDADGLLQWASTAIGALVCWKVDDIDPDKWKVLVYDVENGQLYPTADNASTFLVKFVEWNHGVSLFRGCTNTRHLKTFEPAVK